jgi:hypothetical protein
MHDVSTVSACDLTLLVHYKTWSEPQYEMYSYERSVVLVSGHKLCFLGGGGGFDHWLIWCFLENSKYVCSGVGIVRLVCS